MKKLLFICREVLAYPLLLGLDILLVWVHGESFRAMRKETRRAMKGEREL